MVHDRADDVTWWQWLLGLIEFAICFAYVGWWKRTKARGLLHFWVTEDFAKRRARTKCWWPDTCLCSRKRCRQARAAKIYRREQIIHGGMFCDICGGHGHLPYQCKKKVCRQCKSALLRGQDYLCMQCSMKDKLKAAYEDQQGKQPSRFDQRVLDGVAAELADLYAIPASSLSNAPVGGDGLPHDDCRPCTCDTCSETRYRERQAKMTAHIDASQKWTNKALAYLYAIPGPMTSEEPPAM